MTEIETMHYYVLRKNHAKMVAALDKALDYQRQNPALIRYTLSRTFFREDPDNPDREIWMLIDESTNHDDYAKTMLSAQEDPTAEEFREAFLDFAVPASASLSGVPSLDHVVWQEIPEMHVELPENK
ncbi:hypothetical protein [Lactobacillus sp. ESL0681]|uniref:hypothetical protein n=1 Tax=Lactobacillus sp. ESL0681 TaxID=2983211 RepID=UPI0023F96542|nr:hypothetical protein [Lactobacillus sp. ESL0681]WEV39555.1 hypothetical protein OZX59_04840 [Lactobacillus sp. ESL0681]